MPADVRNAAEDGAGSDRGGRGHSTGCGRRRGFGEEWGAGSGQGAGHKPDVVVGIAASGTTPYVLGGLEWASGAARDHGVTSNPHSPMARIARIAIAPETGPEAIAGSTRMKAGTAQKMVLNMLSTAAMVRLGRVYENWMVYVALTNQKLRRRGARISRRPPA